jgi:polyhydroxyalkanoate synthase
MVAMKKDHLVPWEAAFDGMKLFSSYCRFVLGGSGHVAGSINPPHRNKYCYWINEQIKSSTATAKEWLKTATEIQGSWWNDWLQWILPMAGESVEPREISHSLRDAPGMYVHGTCLQNDFE